MEITLEQLPKAFAQFYNEWQKANKILLEKNNDQQPTGDQLLTIKQAAEILSLSVPTIYGLVSRAEIPVSKRGKRLYFLKQELTSWVKAGRKKTNAEIQATADDFISKRSGR